MVPHCRGVERHVYWWGCCNQYSLYGLHLWLVCDNGCPFNISCTSSLFICGGTSPLSQARVQFRKFSSRVGTIDGYCFGLTLNCRLHPDNCGPDRSFAQDLAAILFYITNPLGNVRYHRNRGLHFLWWILCSHRYGCHSVHYDEHQLLCSDGFLSFCRYNNPGSATDSDTANAFGPYTASGFAALVCARFSGCPHTNSLSKSKARRDGGHSSRGSGLFAFRFHFCFSWDDVGSEWSHACFARQRCSDFYQHSLWLNGHHPIDCDSSRRHVYARLGPLCCGHLPLLRRARQHLINRKAQREGFGNSEARDWVHFARRIVHGAQNT